MCLRSEMDVNGEMCLRIGLRSSDEGKSCAEQER